ncbi:TPA: acyltransferase family protein [Vibrio vulnificus]
MDDKRYIWLDGIRGVSAILVCAGHLRAGLFDNYSSLKDQSDILVKLFYFITSLGHESVVFFFVLSGFFVGGSLVEKRNNMFSFLEYIIVRVSRLWVVLLPALFFTYIMDFFIADSITNGQYSNILNSGPKSDYSIDIATFLYNLFFLQTIISPVYGTNGPLWSLANEFWYYITFPLLLVSLKILKISSSNLLLYRILTALILVFIAQYNLLEGFIIWFFGVAVYILNKRILIISNFIKVIVLFQFLICILTFSLFKISDIYLAASFSSALLVVLKLKNEFLKNFKVDKIFIFISEISYSLYLVHFPIVMLIFYRNGFSKIEFNTYGVILYLLNMLLLIFISYIFWILFESKSRKVRDFMLSAYGKIRKSTLN